MKELMTEFGAFALIGLGIFIFRLICVQVDARIRKANEGNE